MDYTFVISNAFVPEKIQIDSDKVIINGNKDKHTDELFIEGEWEHIVLDFSNFPNGLLYDALIQNNTTKSIELQSAESCDILYHGYGKLTLTQIDCSRIEFTDRTIHPSELVIQNTKYPNISMGKDRYGYFENITFIDCDIQEVAYIHTRNCTVINSKLEDSYTFLVDHMIGHFIMDSNVLTTQINLYNDDIPNEQLNCFGGSCCYDIVEMLQNTPSVIQLLMEEFQ